MLGRYSFVHLLKEWCRDCAGQGLCFGTDWFPYANYVIVLICFDFSAAGTLGVCLIVFFVCVCLGDCYYCLCCYFLAWVCVCVFLSLLLFVCLFVLVNVVLLFVLRFLSSAFFYVCIIGCFCCCLCFLFVFIFCSCSCSCS